MQTERLSIRHLHPDDAAFILELVNDPDWLRFIGDRNIHDLDAARAYIRNGPMAMHAHHGFGLDMIELRDGGIPIGLCGLLQRDNLDAPDLGFAFLPHFRGAGYAREAAAAVLDHATSTLGIARVLAITAPDNHASIRLLQGIGFRAAGMRVLDGESTPVCLFGYPAPVHTASDAAPSPNSISAER